MQDCVTQGEAFFAYYPMVLANPPFLDTPNKNGTSGVKKFQAMGKIVQAGEDTGARNNIVIMFTGQRNGLEAYIRDPCESGNQQGCSNRVQDG